MSSSADWDEVLSELRIVRLERSTTAAARGKMTLAFRLSCLDRPCQGAGFPWAPCTGFCRSDAG